MLKMNWRAVPLLLAAAGILGSMACVVPIPILTLAAHNDAADKRYRPEAEKGSAAAQYQLALCYRAGLCGVEKNLATAWQWLEKAAQGRYEAARTDQADAWLFGDYGQAPDIPRGLAAWRAWAEQGSMNAPFHFATRLLQPGPAWASRAEAARWLETAARRGHRLAGYRLAQQYEAGWAEQPADAVSAAVWYRFGRAATDAQRVEASLTPAQRQQVLARWQQQEAEVQP